MVKSMKVKKIKAVEKAAEKEEPEESDFQTQIDAKDEEIKQLKSKLDERKNHIKTAAVVSHELNVEEQKDDEELAEKLEEPDNCADCGAVVEKGQVRCTGCGARLVWS